MAAPCAASDGLNAVISFCLQYSYSAMTNRESSNRVTNSVHGVLVNVPLG